MRPAAKGGQAGHHFEDDHAEAPPIGAVAVAFRQDELRAHVATRAAHRERFPFENFAAAEVDELRVAVARQHHIFQLEVAKRDGQTMQIFQREGDLRGVKTGDRGRKAALPFHQVEELPAIEKTR